MLDTLNKLSGTRRSDLDARLHDLLLQQPSDTQISENIIDVTDQMNQN